MHEQHPAVRRSRRSTSHQASAVGICLIAVFTTGVMAQGARMPMVAVTPLEARGVAQSDAAIFTESLADVLVRSGEVRVMERSQMDKILAEQGFQQSGACDTAECAVQMGRLLGIDRIVVGSVGKVGETYSLSVRIVDVATGEILASSRRNHRGAIDDVLDRMVPEVGRELTGTKEIKSTAPLPPLTSTKVTESGSSKGWLWWTLGGVAVAGGAAAAVLLLPGDDPAAPTPDEPTDTSVPVKMVLP